MNQDELFIKNRLLELANQCYRRDIPIHSDFLDLNSQNIFHMIEREMPPVSYRLMGGYSLCERKIIVFLPYENYEFDSPFTVIHIKPLQAKFAESLTHRDYLGSIMSLGIKREQFGDLILDDDGAYLFCLKNMAPYLCEQLTSVRHTPMKAETVDREEFDYEPKLEQIQGTVNSIRLDAIIALGFQISRNHIVAYIEEGKVYVNGRLITTNAYTLHEGDIISVRGLGKLRFESIGSTTRKGRTIINIEKFI